MGGRKLWVSLYVITMMGVLAYNGHFTAELGMFLCTAAGIYSGGNVYQKVKTNGTPTNVS